MAVLGGQLGDLPLPRMSSREPISSFVAQAPGNLFTDHPSNSNSSFEPQTVTQASTYDRLLTESQITYLTLWFQSEILSNRDRETIFEIWRRRSAGQREQSFRAH